MFKVSLIGRVGTHCEFRHLMKLLAGVFYAAGLQQILRSILEAEHQLLGALLAAVVYFDVDGPLVDDPRDSEFYRTAMHSKM